MSRDSTSWTLIHSAAVGDRTAREEFVRRYLPLVRNYLRARWRESDLYDQVDDTTQEVLLQCLRPGGGLASIDRLRNRDFRAYLYGIIRNVARMTERREIRSREVGSVSVDIEPELAPDDSGLSRVFDREWSRAMICEAVELQRSRLEISAAGQRRLDLLRLRYESELSIQKIADQIGLPAHTVQRELERAQQEFRATLVEVLEQHRGAPILEVERELRTLFQLLDEN